MNRPRVFLRVLYLTPVLFFQALNCPGFSGEQSAKQTSQKLEGGNPCQKEGTLDRMRCGEYWGHSSLPQMGAFGLPLMA